MKLNNLSTVPRLAGALFSKRLLTMKLTIAFLMAACLQVSAKSYSQRVTLSEKSISIEKALNKIKDQTGCFFFYQHELFKQAGKASG